jgi:hypothetical protein
MNSNPEMNRDVDAQLGAASNRALTVSHKIALMRNMHAQGRADEYWRAAVDLAAELHVLGLALNGANGLLLKQAELALAVTQQGRYLN